MVISRTCSTSGAMPVRTEIFVKGGQKHRNLLPLALS